MRVRVAAAGLVVVWVVGCGSGGAKDEPRIGPPASREASPESAAFLAKPTPNCEDAFRNASHKVPQLSDVKILSRAVAACIKQRWPDESRRCIAHVRSERDLEGCDGQAGRKIGRAYARSHGAADAIAKMATFRDQMCQCADKACADTVTEAMTQWGRDMAREEGERSPEITDEEAQKMSTVVEEMTKCMTKAMMAGLAPVPADPAVHAH